MEASKMKDDKSLTRRTFIKTAVIGAVVATSSAGLSKVITSAAPKAMQPRMHTNDDIQQEKVMLGKEYVLMPKEEKKEMLQMLIRGYKEKETEKEAAATVEERRDFLKNMSVAALVGAATLLMDSEDAEARTTWAEWFQKSYRLMTEEEKKKAIARLEERYSEEYGKKVTVDGSPAMKDVLFGYALNIKK